MGKKDEILNRYFCDSQRFCDFFNGAVFGGDQLLDPKDTVSCETVCRTAGGLRRQRDVCMKTSYQGSYVICAVENQTDIHYGMVVRTMLMDAMEYDRQLTERRRLHQRSGDLSGSAEYLSGLKKGEQLAPVLTLVFYYGEKPWDASRSLRELVKLPPQMERYRSYFPDYPLLLVEPEQINPQNFQTEWQPILTMLKLRRQPEEFLRYARSLGEDQRISPEGLLTAAVLTEDDRLLELLTQEKEERGMNVLSDYMIEKGKMEGLETGRKEGLETGEQHMISLIRCLQAKNRLEEFLAEGDDPQKRARWLKEYGI